MHTKTFSVDASRIFMNKQSSQSKLDRKKKGRNEVPEGGLLQGRTFDSVKKKLTFDEDFTTPTMLPYEAGMATRSNNGNPFMMLLQNGADDSGGIP